MQKINDAADDGCNKGDGDGCGLGNVLVLVQKHGDQENNDHAAACAEQSRRYPRNEADDKQRPVFGGQIHSDDSVLSSKIF